MSARVEYSGNPTGRRETNGSLLHEVQREARSKKPDRHDDEERQARHDGRVRHLRNQNLQNRKSRIKVRNGNASLTSGLSLQKAILGEAFPLINSEIHAESYAASNLANTITFHRLTTRSFSSHSFYETYLMQACPGVLISKTAIWRALTARNPGNGSVLKSCRNVA